MYSVIHCVSVAVTDPEQIQQAFVLAADALTRVRGAMSRLTAVRASYTISNPLFASELFVHSFRLIYRVVDIEKRILTVIHGRCQLPTDPPDIG